MTRKLEYIQIFMSIFLYGQKTVKAQKISLDPVKGTTSLPNILQGWPHDRHVPVIEGNFILNRTKGKQQISDY